MEKQIRRKLSAEFKAKVALEALKNQQTKLNLPIVSMSVLW